MRNTKQRSLVLEIINNSYNHPTAYQVHEECLKVLPNISLGTIYRNLNALVNMGKIQKIDMPDNLTRYDKILRHDHFICTNCSNVYDLNRSDISYNEYIDGNKVCNCKIIYEGICHDCLNK